MGKRQREIGLALIVIVLAGLIVWRVTVPATDPAAATAAGTTAQANAATQPKAAGTEVDLQALKAERPEPHETERNPFRFKPKPPPPPPPTTPVPKQSQAPGAAASPDAPPPPPPPPPIPLKFIGLASSKDDQSIGRVAILSDGRGVYYGREGDVIEGRYRILKIGVESIDLAYLDGRGRQTIRQTGR